MINRFPLKLMIDSRASSLGNSSAFSVSLPEMLHLPEDTAMYVNAASITNTFLSTGTHIGATNHYFYWFEKLDGVDIVFNRCALPEQGYDAEELAGALQTAIKRRYVVWRRSLHVRLHTRAANNSHISSK